MPTRKTCKRSIIASIHEIIAIFIIKHDNQFLKDRKRMIGVMSRVEA